ncbi:type II secretion system protein [Symmachiella dynata]|uniref:type II secretion system protein n=1 Tax=Symmachiella dynata TaxID=2527995 RepID=UPI0030ED1F80
MHYPLRRRNSPPQSRRGFTLVELLIVIVIIAILVGLLVPVVMGVMQNARIAQVRQEISQIENAITAFKTTYGVEPPSQFRLYDDFNLYLSVDAAGAGTIEDTARIKSAALIRRMWRQFDFTANRDWDGDGDISATEAYTLTGPECLVFFLGGIIPAGPGLPNLNGFSKDPQHPFNDAGTSREGPFLEFAASRVRDNSGNPGIPEYYDPLAGQTNPYAYIHSDDYELFDPPTNIGTLAVYKQSEATGSYYKKNTYQIVSPGFDGLYGYGGVYEEDDAGHDGSIGHINFRYTSYSPSPGAGVTDPNRPDNDNITNFAPAELRP